MNSGLNKDITFRQKLRYWFDNTLSIKGAFPFWVTVAVVLGAVAIALLQAVVSAIPALNEVPNEPQSPLEYLWLALGKTLALGTAVTYGDRLMAIVYWFAGLTVMGSIFALRTVALNNAISRMKAAPSPILDKGHTLILGWSPRVFTILRELAVANANQRKPKVVVFANLDRAVMDAQIAIHAPELGNLKVITRKGDTTNPIDLRRGNVAGAKSLIVLDSDRGGDSMIVATVLAARSLSTNPNQKFVAEVDDPNTAEAIESSTSGQVLAVIPRDVIAKVTAQASRQPGIPAVILELLDFAGDEIYFTEVPALVGKTYFEAQVSFLRSAIFGVVPFAKDPVLNPAHDYKLQPGDKLIAIAEDDDKVTYTGLLNEVKRPKASSAKRATEKARNLLVIGWSKMGASVLSELSAFLPKGSVADVVSQERFTEELLEQETKFGDLKVNHIRSTGTFEQLKQLVMQKNYDEVLVLGYRGEKITEAEADGQTLLATMQLNRLFQKELAEGNAPRLVAEILDPLKVPLAQTSSVDDLVVSENLAALLVAQLSENPMLFSIFKDLFNPTKGSAVHVRPITDYAKLGQSISFAELVAAASSQGETAIGWRIRGESGLERVVKINPAKDETIIPFDKDGLIVIGKSI